VIVKRSNTHAAALRREAAGLRFLALQDPLRELVPQYYGIDQAGGILVMGDLAAGQECLLGSILFGDDVHRAEAALIAFNRTLGRLHGCTAGKDATYRELCAQLHVSEPSRHRIHHVLADLAELRSILELTGVTVTTAVEQEIRAAIAELHHPGRFWTFTHGDATPANAFFTGDMVRLFDFETSDFRHALLDGAFARLRYLYSVWARPIPAVVQRRLTVAYREALADGCPAAADDTLFNRALASACAAWLAGLCAFVPSVMQEDRKWGRATIRQRIIAGLDHFVSLNDDVQLFAGLVEACISLRRRLGQTWPESDCSMQIYPALVSLDSTSSSSWSSTARPDGHT
jgi:hypothetical protein